MDNEQVDTEWIFAKKRNFSNIKIYPEAVVTDMEQNEPDEGNLGIDYSDLISTPSVNLLYMLSWDVIGLEEIASFLGVTPETVSHIRKKLSYPEKS